ncbi:MAG TPA: D-alanyl-D-alanine carboxypeptidase family protein [Bauldia sp.]|nr:D-alanyl-D-alanine carboxypeptidase family protein [Bauldia sp.]
MRRALLIAAASLIFAGAQAFAKTDPAYIVVDAGKGVVIGHEKSDRRWPPASVTKVMTAYLVFKALKAGQLKLTSPVVISANAVAEPPSKMGYKAGTVLTVDNALKMMIVRSANDIAVALAETVGGSEANFVKMMNAEARRLGMNGTSFRNPNGLPADGQYSTARDLAVLARATWMQFPEYRDYFTITAIRAGNKVLRNYNTLLDHYRGANGMKTGFICSSGFNVVATATKNGRTLIAVVLGETSAAQRAETAASLLNRGFNGVFGGFLGQDLANFRKQPSPAAPVNLHEEICGKNRPRGETDAAVSALGPRFVVMEPVRVFTGGADPVGATPAAAPAASPGGEVNMPLPRPRPQYPAGAAAASERIAQ